MNVPNSPILGSNSNSSVRSGNVYISLETMSVSPPTARAKSSVGSKIGTRISPKPKVPKTARAVSSTRFHSSVSGGRRSRVPLMAWNLGLGLTPRASERFPDCPARRFARTKRRKEDRGWVTSSAGSFRILREVNFLVLDVAPGVILDGGKVDGGERALHLAGRTHDEAARRKDGALGDERARGDDAAFSDDRAVQDRGAHADEAARLDGAAVQRDGMADGDFVAKDQRVFVAHDVEDRAVLNVGARADANVVDVAAHDNHRPDARVFADDHVSDNDGRGIDVGGGRDLRPLAFVGTNVRHAPQLHSCPFRVIFRVTSRPWMVRNLLQGRDISRPREFPCFPWNMPRYHPHRGADKEGRQAEKARSASPPESAHSLRRNRRRLARTSETRAAQTSTKETELRAGKFRNAGRGAKQISRFGPRGRRKWPRLPRAAKRRRARACKDSSRPALLLRAARRACRCLRRCGCADRFQLRQARERRKPGRSLRLRRGRRCPPACRNAGTRKCSCFRRRRALPRSPGGTFRWLCARRPARRWTAW